MSVKDLYQPKYRQVYRKLLTEIRTGKYNRSGLPGERALAEQFSCCRTTIRRALKSLQHNGILSTRHGKRSQISFLSVRSLRFLWLSHLEFGQLSPIRQFTFGKLEEKLKNNSASLVYWRLHNPKDDTWLMEHLADYDGIIFADVYFNRLSPSVVDKLNRFHKKVNLQLEVSDVKNSVVCTDDYQVGRIAAEYLHKCGMDRIALMAISHGLTSQHFQKRIDGFCNRWLEFDTSAAHQIFLTISRDLTAFCNNPAELLKQLHIRENGIQAFFLLTDASAIACIEGLQKLGFRVPDDISVLGCDNLEAGAAISPPLTTIAHPVDDIVNAIWEILIGNLGISQLSPNEYNTVFPPLLIQRSSVRPLPAAD